MDIYDEILRICLENGFSFFSTLPGSYNIKMIKKLEKLNGKVQNETNLSLIHISLYSNISLFINHLTTQETCARLSRK